MTTKPRRTPTSTLELEFVEIEIFDNFMVSSISEGVTFDLQHLALFVDIFRKYFGDRPFVSIANRVNDYAINPACFKENIQIPNLLGIGVVCYNDASLQIAKFEKKFYDSIYETFLSIEEAFAWADALLESKK